MYFQDAFKKFDVIAAVKVIIKAVYSDKGTEFLPQTQIFKSLQSHRVIIVGVLSETLFHRRRPHNRLIADLKIFIGDPYSIGDPMIFIGDLKLFVGDPRFSLENLQDLLRSLMKIWGSPMKTVMGSQIVLQ